MDKYGKLAVEKIKANLEASKATGKTQESVSYRVEGNTLTVVGARPYFATVQTGSKPSSKLPSPEMLETIKEWMEARGMKGSPWGIAKTILKEGSNLWKAGGRKDIYSNVAEEIQNQVREEISKMGKQTVRAQWR